MSLALFADRQAIENLLCRYCRAVDRLDVPLGRSIWHPEGWADYGAHYYQGPGPDVIDRICADHAALVSHSHQIANMLIEVDGDRAVSETCVTATLRADRDGTLMHIGVWGRYLDQWERCGGLWSLMHRKVVLDHDEMRPVTPSGQPLNGSRDRLDPSYTLFSGFCVGST